MLICSVQDITGSTWCIWWANILGLVCEMDTQCRNRTLQWDASTPSSYRISSFDEFFRIKLRSRIILEYYSCGWREIPLRFFCPSIVYFKGFNSHSKVVVQHILGKDHLHICMQAVKYRIPLFSGTFQQWWNRWQKSWQIFMDHLQQPQI